MAEKTGQVALGLRWVCLTSSVEPRSPLSAQSVVKAAQAQLVQHQAERLETVMQEAFLTVRDQVLMIEADADLVDIVLQEVAREYL